MKGTAEWPMDPDASPRDGDPNPGDFTKVEVYKNVSATCERLKL